VTHVELTPSTASVLPHETIQSLDTLILGGERLSEEHAKEWASLVTLKNSYGPCECTPTATVADICPGGNMTTIGTGVGVNTWIVDAASGQSLVPIGSIGELVLEGPLVGPGYLEPSTSTFSAFIEDPVWLLHGASGRTSRKGRLYRTGDLVVYNEDGSLTFIGRKDAQVKIHGQRVELGDIENHIAQFRQVRQSACILPKAGLCANTLVGLISVKYTSETDTHLAENGFRLSVSASASSALTTGVTFADSDSSTTRPHAEIGLEQLTTTVRDYVEALKSYLDDVLPSYMIPTIWVVLKDIPLDPSGKTSRRQLDDWLSRMDQQTYNLVADTDRISVLRQPVTEAERLLQHACSVVLNVSASDINLARSFVANGGDSISAMRLNAHCPADIIFTVANLLKSKSLVEVALKSPVAASSTTTVSEDFNTPFALSPMQQWFFNQLGKHSVDEPGYHYNQSFYLRMHKTVSVGSMRAAITKIVETHSMLRARFYQEPNTKWMQIIPQPSASNHHFETSMLKSYADLAPFAALRQQQLRVKRGLVFSADFCKVGTQEELYLLLITHHLVIDLVSWRIILADLEAILAGATISLQSLPFQIWNRLQIEEMRESTFASESTSLTSDIVNDLSFWDFVTGKTPNKVQDYVNRTVVIDRDNTRQLLREANNAFNTEPVDLFLAAIWHAFFQIFPRYSFTIVNESHGRDTLKEDTDLSRTVGWFTTMYSLSIARSTNSSLSDIVRRVKDARKGLLASGRASFASKYLRDNRARASSVSETTAEMVFNYHGQFQQLERNAALFKSITLDVSDEGPDLPVSALFEVNISIEQGKTNISFSWNRHLAHQQLIQEWPNQIVRSIRSICELLPTLDARQRTLVDYEFLDLDYPGLDHLETRIIPKIITLNSSEIEDIYPCPPMVDGILLSQLKGSGSYETTQRYHIRPRNPHVIDIERLSVAWLAVVDRHPSLRSVFIESANNTTAFNQVLLNSCRPEIKLHHSENLRAAYRFLQTLPSPHYQQLKPPHRLVLCPISDTDTVLIQIDMSHAITDGESTTILLRDWQRGYAGLLTRADLLETTRGFARALQSDMNKKRLYWTQKLTRVQPCYFPTLYELSQPARSMSGSTLHIDGTDLACIRRSCEMNSITIANLFLAAWALTLSAYTDDTSVCFGYLASGRDLPIPDIMEAIGAFANMLTCRADISRDWSSSRFVQYLHNQVLEDMEHQHCPLAGIQHELKIAPGQQLYNTIISIQQENDGSLDQPADQELEFVDADGEDPTEVSRTLCLVTSVDTEAV
jgi:non-ribosomal peptide synthase protein (TIGR01720 family)